MIEFTLTAPTPSGNVLKRMHHQAIKRQQKVWAWEVVGSMLGARPVEPLPRAKVTIWRHSVGTLDQDNLNAGVKPLVDLLKPLGKPNRLGVLPNPCGLGIIVDDSPAHLTLVVHQIKEAKRTGNKTVVRVEEA
jgi:hypothetical protein